jgi:hypothetical protein
MMIRAGFTIENPMTKSRTIVIESDRDKMFWVFLRLWPDWPAKARWTTMGVPKTLYNLQLCFVPWAHMAVTMPACPSPCRIFLSLL